MNLSFSQFTKLAHQHNVIPLYEELPADMDTPVSAFLKIKDGAHSFLFESVVGGEKWARYSFLGTSPQLIYSFASGILTITNIRTKKNIVVTTKNPLDEIRARFAGYNAYQDPGLPRFYGGLVGYAGYDMVHSFDGIALKKNKNKDLPDLFFMLTNVVVIFDNYQQVMKVVKTVVIEDKQKLKKIYDLSCAQLKEVARLLKKPLRLARMHSGHKKTVVKAGQSKKDFLAGVVKAKELIAAGDIFQVVLSLPFYVARGKISPFEIYRQLRRLNPSPYMFYVESKQAVLVGASPEILVRFEDGKITVRPIAGTRPRGADDAADRALESELKNDPKERSEHLMLVDLGRNDVGRVAKTGSVRVEQNEVIERYSHVMHLVSHVSGELAAGKDVFDVIRAAFPAGTLSGAPKIRAMQIINELEPHSRGVYGGAVGYISFTHNTDLAIAIRSAVVQKDKITIQAGAGIVYNSVPEREYEECVNKAKGMVEALKKVVRI